jgi:hypothetical protein
MTAQTDITDRVLIEIDMPAYKPVEPVNFDFLHAFSDIPELISYPAEEPVSDDEPIELPPEQTSPDNGDLDGDGEFSDDELQMFYGTDEADTFHFSPSTSPWAPTVVGFESGKDVVLIDQSMVPTLEKGALDAAAFLTADFEVFNPDYQILFDNVGNLVYDPDGDGPEAGTVIAALTDAVALTASDIIVV